MIHFKDLTIQEADLLLAGLRELPMKLVQELHQKLHISASAQYQNIQQASNPAPEQQAETPSA